MKDELGDRMKGFYEDRTRYYLPRRSYTIIRIDGKSFHTYTRGLKRPFDADLMEDMNLTTEFLCKNIQGAKFGYVQSDEISILITDFEENSTDAWFDNNVQKMASIASSLATSEFNRLRTLRYLKTNFEKGVTTITELWFEKLNKEVKQAQFDARVFQIPFSGEVENYFIWRQQDATRNSISSVAQANFSHSELNGVTTNMMQEMLFQKIGINWNDYTSREKRGGFVTKVDILVPGVDPRKPRELIVTTRNRWDTIECPIFTQDREFLKEKIPQ